MVIRNFNCLESAQKIHASRCWCNIHAHWFWWAWPLQARRYCYFQKQPNFPFDPWAIVHGHQRFNWLESAQKFMQISVDVNIHAHWFWWAWPLLVSEILILSKTAKFPFRPMDYSPWSSKNLINRNQLKKFMQVGDWCNIHAHQFWWAWPLRFRRYCYFQKRPNFPFDPWTIVHGHQKI